MTDAQPAPVSGPMSVRLHIPSGARYRALASALAGKFAEVAGCGGDQVRSLRRAFDRAAEDVVALEDCADAEGLKIEFTRANGRVQVTIICGRHRARIARSVPR